MVNQISHNDNSQFDVDIVYLWVDGNDENLKKSINSWKEKLNIPISNDTNTCRYIDNEELKYSLRSVEKNIPWIHKIYIVTNGQVPKWLNTNNSKIRIVTHEEIMPKEVMPTFNSRVIESFVANIPELSEHFLVANDDCFVARPMKKFDFFTKDGKPRVRLFPKQLTRPELKKSLYNRSIFYSIQLLKKKFNKKYKYVNQHNIDAYTKTDYVDCINEFSNEFSDLREMRFRRLSVQRIIFSLYLLATGHGKLIKPKSIWFDISSYDRMKKHLRKSKPELFCINDEPSVNDLDRENLKYFLEELFPDRQEWEKESSNSIEPHYDAENRYTIVLSANNENIKHYCVTLESLFKVINSAANYEIHIFDHGISTYKKNIIQNNIPSNVYLNFINTNRNNHINFKAIDVHNINLDVVDIPYLFSKYEKVLYLGSDVCIKSDLNELFNKDIAVLGAVRDFETPILYQNVEKRDYISLHLKIKKEQYFSDSILLFNLKNFDYKKYSAAIKNAQDITYYGNVRQDILNVIYNDTVTILPFEWGYNAAHDFNSYNTLLPQEEKEAFEKIKNDIKIIYFPFCNKPYYSRSSEWFAEYFRQARNSIFYEEIVLENKKDILKFINDVERKYAIAKILSQKKLKQYYKRELKDLRELKKEIIYG